MTSINNGVSGLGNNHQMRGPQNVDDILKELEKKEKIMNIGKNTINIENL